MTTATSTIARAGIRGDVLEHVLTWVREREMMRVRKEAGEAWPWTSNALLRDYRWCNVRRADDRVSRELLAAWYDTRSDVPTLLAAATLGRLVNWPTALLEVTSGAPFGRQHLATARAVLLARASREEKVFTGANVVPGVPGRTKVDSVCDLVERVIRDAVDIWQPTLRGTWEKLIAIDGLGSFLAGQIVADVALLPAGEHWPDRRTWAPVGPGSARGWNRLIGAQLDRRVSQQEFDIALPVFSAILDREVPDIVDRLQLCAQDKQSILCESDKYLRLLNREGSVRARYAPPIQNALF